MAGSNRESRSWRFIDSWLPAFVLRGGRGIGNEYELYERANKVSFLRTRDEIRVASLRLQQTIPSSVASTVR